jgi:RND family efflux transporter MFP subunit
MVVVALIATTVLVTLAVSGAFRKNSVSDGGSTTVSTPEVKQLWHCGMHPQVIQDHPGECPICHMALTPMNGGGQASTKGAEQKVLYWWDPMLGTSSISDHPGKSAIGMDLVPVYAESAGPDVEIDPAIVQNMGVRTAQVVRGPLSKTVRTVGILTLPEPGMFDVSLKVTGWIDKLHANQEGMHIEKGAPLFEVYSPELQVAVQELISAVKISKTMSSDTIESGQRDAKALVNSAKRKLLLWGIAEEDISAIEQQDEPPRDIVFRSPITGHVEEKMVVEGASVEPGAKLLRIADHTKMWLEAQVYADDISLVKTGQEISARIEGLGEKNVVGTIAFISPHVDPATRTVKVRGTFDNPDLELKPGMYATATIATKQVGDAIILPREAIIDTGSRQIVFVADGSGHFSPRKVSVASSGDDDKVAVSSGLAPGELVVTSGQFLIDVESRTIEATQKLISRDAQPEKPRKIGVQSEMTLPTTTPIASSPLTQIYCPMASASWLQIGDTVRNPYMGQRMSDCGETRAKVPTPKTDSNLSQFVSIYLETGDALNADKIDPTLIAKLKSAANVLPEKEYSSLRKAVNGTGDAGDIKAIRKTFKTVSKELIAALEEPEASKQSPAATSGER